MFFVMYLYTHYIYFFIFVKLYIKKTLILSQNDIFIVYINVYNFFIINMKIQDFIYQSKNIHLKNELNQSIYQQTLQKISNSQKNWYSRFFYKKIYLAAILIFGLWFLLYYDNTYIQNINNIKVIKSNSANIVYADNIAKIISFDWSYSIYHNNKPSKNIDISDWDVVVLDIWSKIKFDINSENYGEVYGPAKFSIKKDWPNKYLIYISELEYFKFYKKINTKDDIFNKLLSNNTETTISTNTYQIKWKNLNLIIAKKSNNETFIKNNGDNLTIINSSGQTELPTNKIAKIDKSTNIIWDISTWNIDQDTNDKINNPDIILLASENQKNIFDIKSTGNSLSQNIIDDTKVKLPSTKILVKKFINTKVLSGDNNTWSIIQTWKQQKLLSIDNLSYTSPILSYKNTQYRFDNISNKLASYDRTYIEDVYIIWDNLAQIHTKLWLPINYYPNIYYIKYMSDNLKNYLSQFDNVPNDYIYSLTYISKMMDELNQKKPWDSLANDYNLVPEIMWPQNLTWYKFNTWNLISTWTISDLGTWINKDILMTMKKLHSAALDEPKTSIDNSSNPKEHTYISDIPKSDIIYSNAWWSLDK